MPELPTWFTTAGRWLHDHSLLAPLVQFGLATLFAILFAERWQRWRQRRDFQHRTLVKFNELSYDMMDRLAELLVARAGIQPAVYLEKRREFIARWSVFASIRGEVIAAFGRRLVLETDYQGVFAALNKLREYVGAPQPVPQATFEPEQEKFLAHREAVVAHMIRAMGFLSREEWRAEVTAARERVQAASEAASTGVAPVANEGTPKMTPTEQAWRPVVRFLEAYPGTCSILHLLRMRETPTPWVLLLAPSLFVTMVYLVITYPDATALRWACGLLAAWIMADYLFVNTSIAFVTRDPKSELRSAILTLAVFANLALGFSVFHALQSNSFKPLLTPLCAVYFSFVTIATVGYGDITPATSLARLTVVSEIIVGLYFLAVILAVITGWAPGPRRG